VNVRINGGKTSSTSVGVVGAGWAPTRALDLFDSGSSAFDGEATSCHTKSTRGISSSEGYPKTF
jgi:hypothetical protein